MSLRSYTVARLVHRRGNMRQGLVLDVLALNWLACSIANGNGLPKGGSRLASSSIWFLHCGCRANVRGVSGIAEIFYIALILFNAAYFFRHFHAVDALPVFSILSWGSSRS